MRIDLPTPVIIGAVWAGFVFFHNLSGAARTEIKDDITIIESRVTSVEQLMVTRSYLKEEIRDLETSMDNTREEFKLELRKVNDILTKILLNQTKDKPI